VYEPEAKDIVGTDTECGCFWDGSTNDVNIVKVSHSLIVTGSDTSVTSQQSYADRSQSLQEYLINWIAANSSLFERLTLFPQW
jgi:hypothetical protein